MDFFDALNSYKGEKKLECPNENISSDDCTKWPELFILIVWKKTEEELTYDQTMGSENDFYLLSNTVLKELRRWKKVIKIRAGVPN